MVEKTDGKKKTAAKKAVKSAAPAKESAAGGKGEKVDRPRRKGASAGRETPPIPGTGPGPDRAQAPVSRGPAPIGVQDLKPARGATRSRKRVGRGPGSGHGKTAGRGSKGQKSRSGYRHQRGFEGGQMPLHRRVPKRGFTNIFRVVYDVVNISDLERFDAGDSVTPEKLAERRLAHGRRPVKILGDGELKKALTVSAHKFSASAKSRIEAAGGSCEVLNR
jgi:large subunit ribosomal protein L15